MNEIDSMMVFFMIVFIFGCCNACEPMISSYQIQNLIALDSHFYWTHCRAALQPLSSLLQPVAALRFGPFVAFVPASTRLRAALWPPLLLNSPPCRAARWPPLFLQHDGWHRWRFGPSLFFLFPRCSLSLGALLISSYALSSCHGRCKPLPWQQLHQGSSCWSGVCWSHKGCQRNTEKEESVTQICTRSESPKVTARVDCWLFSFFVTTSHCHRPQLTAIPFWQIHLHCQKLQLESLSTGLQVHAQLCMSGEMVFPNQLHNGLSWFA